VPLGEREQALRSMDVAYVLGLLPTLTKSRRTTREKALTVCSLAPRCCRIHVANSVSSVKAGGW
jgi:hypothetical protein